MKKQKTTSFSETRLCILIMLFMSVLFLWQIFPDFTQAIPYSHNPDQGYEIVENFQGDHLQWLYHLALPAKFIQGKTELFTEGFQFQTPYKSDYINLHFPPAGIVYLLFSPLGLATAYNLTLLFFLFFSLITCWLMLRDFNFSNTASLAGSCVYSFAPYKLSVMIGGHPAGMLLSLLPLFIFFFNRMLYSEKKSYGLYAGITLICLAASEPHYHYYFVIVMPLLYIFLRSMHIFSKEHKNPLYEYRISSLFTPLRSKSIALISLVIFLFSYFIRRSMPLLPVVPLALFIIFLFSVAEIFIKNTLRKDCCYLSFGLLNFYTIQFLYETPMLATILIISSILLFFRSIYSFVIKTAVKIIKTEIKKLPSYIPFIIGTFFSVIYMLHVKSANYDSSGIKAGRTLSEISLYAPHLKDMLNYAAKSSSHFVFPGFIVFIIITLSTIFIAKNTFRKKTINNRDYLSFISIIAFYFFYLLSFGPNVDFLPLFTALRKIIPYFSFIRSPIKIIVLAFLALSVTAAAFLNNKKSAMIAVILLFSEALYFHSSFGICLLNKTNPAFREISQAEKKILYLPVWPGNSSWESLYQLYSLYTDKNMINGYQPAVPQGYMDNIADKLYSLNLGIINTKQYKLLKSLEVDTIVYNKEAFPRKVSPFPQQYTFNNLKNSPFIKFSNFHDPLAVFKLKNTPDNKQQTTQIFPTGFMIEAEHSKRSLENTALFSNETASLKQGVILNNKGELYFKKHFPKGNYKFTTSILSDHKANFLLEIKNEKSTLYKNNILTKGSSTVVFEQNTPFSLTEFKIMSLTNDLKVDFFYIEHDKLPFPEKLNPGDGIYTGELLNINGENVISISDSLYNKGPAFFTPNRLLPKGNYLAEFILKYSPSYNTSIEISVTDAHGIHNYAKTTIKPEKMTGDWQKFALPFSIKKHHAIINLLAEYPGQGNMQIKYYMIHRNES